MALAFLAAGIQAFVLSYSVLPALWPRQFLEGAAALAWMRANAPELGFRPDRVAVCGFSAGGHLAGCLAGGYAEPLLNERLGLTPEQVRPDAAILGYPVVHEARYLDPLGGAEVLRPDRRVVQATRPPFSGPRWGTPRCRWKIPWTMPTPCGRGRCFELHLFQDGPHAMGLADRESARDGAHYNAHAAAWHPLCIDWLKGKRMMEQKVVLITGEAGASARQPPGALPPGAVRWLSTTTVPRPRPRPWRRRLGLGGAGRRGRSGPGGKNG